MRTVAAAVLAAAAVFVLPALALADGYSVGPYRWVFPPKYQVLTNLPPTGVKTTKPVNFTGIIETSDVQVQIDVSSNHSFPSPSGQHTFDISVQPLRHFHKPTMANVALNGNVYGISFRYLPSGKFLTHTHGRKNILITMDAPHDTLTNQMWGFFRHRWRVLCSPRQLIYEGPLPGCFTRTVPRQLAMFYNPSGRKRAHAHKSSSGPLSIFIIVAIVIIVLWVGIVLFLLTRRAASSSQTQLRR